MDGPDQATRIEAAQAWLGWEDNAATLQHDVDAQSADDPLDTLAPVLKRTISATASSWDTTSCCAISTASATCPA